MMHRTLKIKMVNTLQTVQSKAVSIVAVENQL